MKEVLKHMFTQVLYIILGAVVIAGLSYGGYSYYLLNMAYGASETSNINLQYQFGELSDKLKATDALNSDLKTLLQVRQQEKEAVGEQVQTLSTTVSVLDKLSKTDKQLLEKYSSVYFLNENYKPQNLSDIDSSFLYRPDKPLQILTGIGQHLSDLLNSAKVAGVPLQVLSSYRSFGTQQSLKASYKIVYGAGTANSFSSDQGYSEHQLGTTVDFTTPAIGETFSGFEKATTYAWLSANAYLYGFNLSYPKGNTHFVFEPWHWRYVGIELAKKLHEENKTLYDLDQREIDTYLVRFFD
ncbi:MAG: M15 family metallopeptidase [bacterium]|nr:M15 family metallopeptidase [bacterium]